MTATGDNFHIFPAFGEQLCSTHDITSIDIIHIIAAIYDDCKVFPTIGNVFQLPQSIFAEVPVLMGIYNQKTEMHENVLMHFQGACAYYKQFAEIQEKSLLTDEND